MRGGNTLKSRARTLRQQSTDAERLLWKHLRDRRLEGYKFRRQVIIKQYIADFFCLDAQLIVEADGGQHAEQIQYDVKRTGHLENMGYRVLRFWNNEILGETEGVLERIRLVLVERTSSYSFPSPQGEGVRWLKTQRNRNP